METKPWAKLFLFAAAIIWGLSFVIVKNAIDIIPPLLTIGIRFLIAYVILSAIFFRKYKLLDGEYIKHGITAGFLLWLAYAVQTIGLADTTPGKNAFLTAGYCIITPFLYWFMSRKKPSVYNILAAVVCMTGFGFVSLDGSLSIAKGDLLSILCGFFYALHISYVAKIYGDKDPVLFSMIQFATAAAISIGAGLMTETLPQSIPLSYIPRILYLAIGATAIGLLFQTIGQKYTNPSAAALILCLESVFGVIFSLMLYDDERLTPRLVIGFGLIFIAILISEVLGGKANERKNENIQGQTPVR